MRGLSLAFRRWRLSLDLLVGRKLVMVIVVDAFVLFFVALQTLMGEDFDPWAVVLIPGLLIGAPLLSELVALERRAGSLDIALSSPGADSYFERRAGSLLLALLAQSGLLLLGFRLTGFPYPFLLVPALLKSGLAFTFLAVASLFWAVRLSTAGAVLFSTWLSALAVGPWLFPSPVIRVGVPSWTYRAEVEAFSNAEPLLSLSRDLLVLGVATAVLYSYARRRLSRPESLLS